MRTAPLAALLLITALGLSACAPERELEPAPTSSPGDTPTEVPGATAAPGSTLTDCDDLVGPDAMYTFSENVALDEATKPAAGSLAATIAGAGIGCGWLQLSSGETIIVSAVRPLGDVDLDTDDLTATADFDSPGYFDLLDGAGQAVVITDGWALVATSPMFTESAEAAIVVNAAIASLNG